MMHTAAEIRDSDIKVFCFFSSEKKALLSIAMRRRSAKDL
jgi:hypothetical protein